MVRLDGVLVGRAALCEARFEGLTDFVPASAVSGHTHRSEARGLSRSVPGAFGAWAVVPVRERRVVPRGGRDGGAYRGVDGSL